MNKDIQMHVHPMSTVVATKYEHDEIIRCLHNTSASVRKLRHYLSKLEEDVRGDLASGPCIYFLDWDIIREATIESDLASSVYAASIIASMVFAKQAGMAVYIPEGAKYELLDFLMRSSRSVFTQTRRYIPDIPTQAEIPFTRSFQGVYQSERWVAAEKRTFSLKKQFEIFESLDFFLKNYTEPVEKLVSYLRFPFTKISTTNEYSNALAEIQAIRPNAPKRNRADATNIALLDLSRSANIRVNLVTGTRILAELRRDAVVDPVYFLFASYYRKLFANNLPGLSGHLLTLLSFLSDVESKSDVTAKAFSRASKSGYQTTRRSLDEFKDDLDQWLNNTKLKLPNIFSLALIEAQNRLQMLDTNKSTVDYNTEILKGVFYRNDYLERMDSLINHIYPEVNYSLQDMGFDWSRKDSDTHTVLHLERNSRNVLTVERTPETIMFSWDTFGTIKVYFKQIEYLLDLCKLNHRAAIVALLFDEHPSIYTSYDKLASKFYKLAHKMRISGIRLFTPSAHLLYRLGDKSLKTDATLSVLIPLSNVKNSASIECVAQIFNNTSRFYIPGIRLNASLSIALGKDE